MLYLKDEDSILESVRATVIGSKDNSEFDKELIPHINSCISILNQNGIGNTITVRDTKKTWGDLKDPQQFKPNKHFHMVNLFMTMKTKLVFDPPPPSNVEQYKNNIDELLWRLKIEYELEGWDNNG